MIGNHLARLTGSKRNLLALLASITIFTAGCANMASTAPDANSLSVAAPLSGHIHGGNQPVVGATVSLYYAGQAPNVPALAATTTTDNAGSFGFQSTTPGQTVDTTKNIYSCPTGSGVSNPLVYVIAKGGNTLNDGTSNANSAAAFLGIYDFCNSLTSANQIDLTEVTTVATMVAVQQFFNPAQDTIQADGTGQQKIIIGNLKNTIALLANVSTGTAVTSTVINAPTGAGSFIVPGVTVTATPEPGKINLLANILSACINNASASATACTTLFNAAVPPTPNITSNNPTTYPKATDTLQALFYILTNPTNTASGTSNLGTLFGLAGGLGGPYQPALPTQPTDWTVAINYTSTSTCGNIQGGSGGFISSPIDIAIDSANNVWIANSQAGIGNLSELAANGAPTVCFLFGGGATGGVVVDSNSTPSVWVGSTNALYRFTPSTEAALSFPVTGTPVGLAADGLGNVYYTAVSGTNGSLYQLPGAAGAALAVTPVQISSTVGVNPVRLMPDYQGQTTQSNIWVSSGAGSISQVVPSTTAGNLNGFVTNSLTTSGNSYGLSISHINSVFTAASDTGVVDSLVPNSGVYSSSWTFSPTAAGIAGPTAIAVDGRANTWIANHTNGASTGSISAITNAPNPISSTTGFQKSLSYLSSGRAMAIDQAGNVWVAGDGANFITEVVGAAVPIFQPYSLGLKVNRFQTIP